MSSQARPRKRPAQNDMPETLSYDMPQLDLSNYIAFGTLVASKIQGDAADIADARPEFTPQSWSHGRFSLGASAANQAPVSQLIQAQWMRVFCGRHHRDPDKVCLFVYTLPDDVANRDVPRNSPRLRAIMTNFLRLPFDSTSEAWSGYSPTNKSMRDLGTWNESPPLAQPRNDESLFYIFNTISSPAPDPSFIEDPWASEAAEKILGGQEGDFGLKTRLYPYQRRSIANMMQREFSPGAVDDPRLERHIGPTGKLFYLDRVTSQIYLQAAQYLEPRGGILAETMGYGKTLIVLGLVAATSDNMPKTPVEYIDTSPITSKTEGTRSLLATAASHAVRQGISWRQFFRDQADMGAHFETCTTVLNSAPYYEMIDEPTRNMRQKRIVRRILLCRTTLVVVPSNLFDQWRAEISKHLKSKVLKVLEVNEHSPSLPGPEQLSQYDMILMDKRRFYIEMGHMPADSARQACQPTQSIRQMHFLRLVIDEGHTFASTGSASASMTPVSQLLVERRWVVSGTPSQGLVGVEVDLVAAQVTTNSNNNQRDDNSRALERRKRQKAEDNKDLVKLGRIATELLQAQPWCNSVASGDAASWTSYTRLPADNKEVFYSAPMIKTILASLIVRHKIDDIEAELPPLTNKTVFLTPTLYDKASMDLFTFVYMNNAITSERVDQDYLFHERNRKYLDSLTRNLRRAPFFWSGFELIEMQKSLEVAEKYVAEHPDMSQSDRSAILHAMEIIPCIINNKIWQKLSESHEVGLSVDGFPQPLSAPLGIDDNSIDLVKSRNKIDWTTLQQSVLTAPRLLACQKFCEDNAALHDPIRAMEDVIDKIANVGDHSDKVLYGSGKDESKQYAGNQDKPKVMTQNGPASLTSAQFAKHRSGLALKAKKKTLDQVNQEAAGPVVAAAGIIVKGTVSAKLSYLMSQIHKLHKTEKSLVFYEGDDIAWYIAQGLEILGIPHFIYANKIGRNLRSSYLETFTRDDSEERVMLIDLRQGGHGLNITVASRVFFVNPVWQVGTEAQAIKRAHRIGQTKPVHVETLILKDSVEHRIFERRRQLSRTNQAHQKVNPLDDAGVFNILQEFRYNIVGRHDFDHESWFAPVDSHPQVFPSLAASQEREEQRKEQDRTEPKAASVAGAMVTESTSPQAELQKIAFVGAAKRRPSSDHFDPATDGGTAPKPAKKVKLVGFA